MPFVSHRAQLRLGSSEIKILTTLSQSRSEPAGRVQRASILLRYHAGDTVSEIAGALGTNRPRVERCVSKALDLGYAQELWTTRLLASQGAQLTKEYPAADLRLLPFQLFFLFGQL